MPYYGHIYYGYGDFLANNLYVLLLIPVLLLSLWAQFQVSGSFRRYNAVNNRRRITGAQAAEAVLRAHGVFGVPVRPCRGNLTDHYDPRDNTIYLSEEVYNAPTIAAVGVAAHEAGHAVQYARHYAPIYIRAAIVPVTNIGSRLSMPLIVLGLALSGLGQVFYYVALAGVACYGLCVVFQLVTLPTEFNASHRALRAIEESALLLPEEQTAAKRVLTAAALTYVAALLSSLLQLLRCGVHGQAHIGARVAVRHGKNVQGIYRFAVFFQQGRAGHHHIAQQHAVNRLGLYQRFFLLTR